jgi:SAM-dependent methyltransferase
VEAVASAGRRSLVWKGDAVTAQEGDGLAVPPGLQRGAHDDREEWVESGLAVVEVIHRAVGRDDLGGISVLDVGCGTKVVKTLLDRSLPIGRYVGIDVSADVVGWLRDNVDDPRFEFQHLDAHNDLYNPGGVPLADFEQLPAPLHAFDVICLFSVFTHLAPDDYVAMLHLLRRHVASDGRLVFSVFLNDPDNPSPYALALERALASDDQAAVDRARSAVEAVMQRKDRGFIDEIPDKPLLQARYDKDFALELIERTGWEVQAIDPPGRHIQHAVFCRPV